MENQTENFKKEKIAVIQKIATELFSDLELTVGQTAEDLINNTVTIELSTFIYSKLIEERNLEYWFDRPTFFDWLLRRKRKAVFNLKIKDLLINVPKTENTIRSYFINQ